MNFTAIGDTVIVEIPEVQKETKRESGIVLIQEDPTRKTTLIGTIVSVGEGKFDSNKGTYIVPPVTIGDKIVLSLSTGIELDKTHRMVKVDDIFAIVR